MLEFIKVLILGIIQGISEWLPISSSGHLVLLEAILDYKTNVTFDVALHFGTLMAVFVYFGKDILDILEAVLKRKWKSQEGKTGLLIALATIPAAFFGYFFNKYFKLAFTNLLLVALGFGITGLILLIASLDFKKNKKESPSWLNSLGIGFAQALAIFPGISRSGTTISAGLLAGLTEKNAIRFSFLLSIPIIFGAGILEIGNNRLDSNLIWATLIAFAVGLASIYFLMKVISKNKKNLKWFGFYTLLLSLAMIIYLIFN